MMKTEYSPFSSQDEEDEAAARKAELDDDDDKKKEKDKKKTLRHAPGISFEKVKPETDGKDKKRLSITDRFLESIGAKPEKKPDDEEEAKPEKQKDDEEPASTVESNDPTVHTEENTVSINNVAEAIVPDKAKQPVEKVPAPTSLEAADWEPEESVVEAVRTPEAQEEFAEVPEPVEVADDTEVGPVEPELLASGIGSEGPPKPPEDVPGTTEPDEPEPTPPPRRPAAVSSSSSTSGGGYTAPSPWYNAAAADRKRSRELEDAENDGHRAGIRRGLGAGLLFGWMFGRHGKKKQAKAYEKQLKTRDKEIENLKTEQGEAAGRLESVRRTQERLRSDMHEQQLKASKGAENAPRKASAIEVATATAALKALERSTASIRSKERFPQVADGRRVETSAWHRIEIDKKTGNVVKNPGIAYGREFKREQKEVYNDGTDNPYDTNETEKPRREKAASNESYGASSNSAVQLGGLAAAYYERDTSSRDSEKQESGFAALQPQSANEDKKGSRLLKFAATPIIWIAAIVVVVVLFIAGVLR